MYIGTSIGSNDVEMIPFLLGLKDRGILNYVELYIQPDVKISEILTWKKSGLVSICHAPHGEKSDYRYDYMEIGIQAASFFDPRIIVYDAGINNPPKTWNLPLNCVAENMPIKTSFGDVGMWATPQSFSGDFCLDFAHAWITAGIEGVDPKTYLQEFMRKKPVHFHLTDVMGARDHVLLGSGEMDLKFVASLLRGHMFVTIETDHELPNRKDNITSDLLTFNKYI